MCIDLIMGYVKNVDDVLSSGYNFDETLQVLVNVSDDSYTAINVITIHVLHDIRHKYMQKYSLGS